MESKPKVGKGQGYEKGGYVPGKEKDVQPVKRPPGRGKDLAPARRFKGKYEGYAEGGPVAEITEGDGMSPLQEMAYALPYDYMKDIVVERELPALPEPPPFDPMRGVSLGDRVPVGALTPLPEEPMYRVPLAGDDGMVPGRVRLRPEPVDRVGNRRAMMGDRRDMAMRPGMRGVARRAAPPRMRAPAPVRQPEMMPFDLEVPMPLVPRYKKGGEVKGEKIAKVMREYKEGKLHSGSKKGPVVKNPKQAMAIALSEARAARKADGGRIEKLKKSIIADDLAKARKLGKTYNEMYRDEFNKQVKEGILNPSAVKAKKAYELHTPKEVRKVYESDKEYFEKMASQNKKAEGGVMSKGPSTRYTAAKGRRMAKERAMERRALDKARHAEKYAPGLSLDMEDESTVPTYQSLKPRKKVEMLKYAKGGKAKHSDVKMDKAMVKKAVHKHEKAMHPGKKMTKLNKGGVPSYGRKPMYGGGKC
jgi:hypothetical protein